MVIYSKKLSSRNLKDRNDEINEIIENAQKNAQNLIAANPGITSVFDLKMN